VQSRREGKWIHYRLVGRLTARGQIIDTLLEVLAQERQMQRDRAALERVCCGVRLLRRCATRRGRNGCARVILFRIALVAVAFFAGSISSITGFGIGTI